MSRLACAEYGGIICIEQGSSYETDEMMSYRAWKIAERVDVSKTKIKKKQLDLIRHESHMDACTRFVGCEYVINTHPSLPPTRLDHPNVGTDLSSPRSRAIAQRTPL